MEEVSRIVTNCLIYTGSEYIVQHIPTFVFYIKKC